MSTPQPLLCCASTLALMLVALTLVACAPGDGDDSTQTFALVPKAMNNPFFDLARDGCIDAAAETPEADCLYIGPGEHLEQEQVQIVQDLITRRVDGIAVAPSNAPAMARALERAQEAGIPVITWDSDLLEEHHQLRASYVGTLNRDIGVEQAKVLMTLKPDGGTLCIQSGGPAAANHNERMQGLRDTLRGSSSDDAPGPRLDGSSGWSEVDGCPLYSNDDFPLAVQQLADLLAREPELDAFVATGGFPQFAGQAYRQVAERYADRITSNDTIVIVADTLPIQMELLGQGHSHAQVGQRPYEMGRQAFDMLRRLASGESVAPVVYTGLDVCTQLDASTCLDSGTAPGSSAAN